MRARRTIDRVAEARPRRDPLSDEPELCVCTLQSHGTLLYRELAISTMCTMPDCRDCDRQRCLQLLVPTGRPSAPGLQHAAAAAAAILRECEVAHRRVCLVGCKYTVRSMYVDRAMTATGRCGGLADRVDGCGGQWREVRRARTLQCDAPMIRAERDYFLSTGGEDVLVGVAFACCRVASSFRLRYASCFCRHTSVTHSL
jgi:hypothetical protein